MRSCFLCGIGGSGVSALAALLQARGWAVSGSDRSRDRGETPAKFAALEAMGIALYPQDGSGVAPDTAMVVVSSAVEETVPDIQAARRHDIPVRRRAEILADLAHQARLSVTVGGTSGKSTTTAMTGWILHHAGLAPTIVNGALMTNFQQSASSPPFSPISPSAAPPASLSASSAGHAGAHGGAGLGNTVIGGDDLFVAEVDESDGSIALFRPAVAVLTNISLDHKPMAELRTLFGDYIARADRAAVINSDDPESRALAARAASPVYSFALDDPGARFAADSILPSADGVAFTVRDRETGESAAVALAVPGRHNVANALAAIAASCAAGVNLAAAAAALGAYKGLHRRFEAVGVVNRITVIDDFGHNPDKIAATLKTLHETPGRIWAVFQAHGFGPTKLMRPHLVDIFAALLRPDDTLLMPEIYYAGGTATRDISAADIVRDVAARGRQAHFFETRAAIVPYLAAAAAPGDRIVILGARDDTLPAFARDILAALPA